MTILKRGSMERKTLEKINSEKDNLINDKSEKKPSGKETIVKQIRNDTSGKEILKEDNCEKGPSKKEDLEK